MDGPIMPSIYVSDVFPISSTSSHLELVDCNIRCFHKA